jgi:hypothetical protein
MEWIYAKIWGCGNKFHIEIEGKAFKINVIIRVENKNILLKLFKTIKESNRSKSKIKVIS